MTLNNTSYLHKRIRSLCYMLEQSTGMKLQTDLSSDFTILHFKSELSYITIAYERNIYATLNYKLNKAETSAIEEIIIALNFIAYGIKFRLEMKNKKLH